VDKKLYACQKEHIKFELKAGKNFVVELSTGAYEVVKRIIPALLETAGLDNSYSMVNVQEGKEESGLTVDSCYRIFNEKQNGSAGNILKVAINLYHTSCKMTVNGSRIDIFINELFDLIYKQITIEYSDIQLLNNSLQTYLTHLKNYSSSCIHKASTDCITLCKSASLNNNPEPNCSTIVIPTSNEFQDKIRRCTERTYLFPLYNICLWRHRMRET
jgi:hypothetical protein